MPSTQYKLIFKGECLPDVEKETVKKRLMQLFNISEKQAENLVQSKNFILKENLSNEAALALQKKLKEKIGIITYIDCYTDNQNTTSKLDNKNNHIEERDLTADSKSIKKEDTRMDNHDNQSGGKKSVYILCSLLFLIGVGGYLGYKKYPKTKPEPSTNQKATHQSTPTTNKQASSESPKEPETTIANHEEFNTNLALNSEEQTAPKCADQSSAELIGRLLVQGFPDFIQQNNPNIELVFNKIHINEELYFDPVRNKRLCALLSEYTATDKSSNNTNNLAFEIVYEIYYNSEKILNITTFKHQLLGSIKDKYDLDSLKLNDTQAK